MDDQLGTLKSIRAGLNDQYRSTFLSGATISVPVVGIGFLHTIVVGQASAPTLTIYDNASGASGTIIALIEPGAKGTYIVDTSFSNGITALFQLGNAPSVTLSYK